MRFLKFSLAGTLGFVVQVASVSLLTSWAAALPGRDRDRSRGSLSSSISCGTKPDLGRSAVGRRRSARLLRFNALTAVTSIVGSVIVTAVLVESFTLSPILANVISVGVLGVINFIGADRLVFRSSAAIGLMLIANQGSFVMASEPKAPVSGEAILQAKTVRDFAKYVGGGRGASRA